MSNYTGTVVCTQGCVPYMAKDKKYFIEDGFIVWDDGHSNLSPFLSIHDFNNRCFSQIKEILQPKDHLQMGRIVKHKNGDMGFVLKHSILYPYGLNPIHIFKEDLTSPSGRYDIMEIYEPTVPSCFNYDGTVNYLGQLIWKREELTPEQIERKAIEQEQRELAEKQKQLADRLANLEC